ncbi:MAG: type II CAAX prenyl endopeptidase Rce1 family protein [Eubacteriales bacterium]
MKCPRCGAENYSGAKFCTTCKTALTAGKPGVRGVVSAVFHALFYIFVFFACQYLVTMGYMMSLMTGALSSGTFDESALFSISEQVVQQTVMISLISNLLTILVVCILFQLRKKNPAGEFDLRPVNRLRCPTFFLFGAALNLFVSGTISFLPLPQEVIESFETQYSSLYGETPLALEIFSIAIVTGITEEIVFRGLVTSRLSRGMRTGTAVVVSSVLFGLAHGTLLAAVYAALLGLVFTLMYEKFHSIVPSMLCHIAFNATSYLLEAVNDRWFFPLYLFSIAVMLFCAYRIFFRRPTFYDYVLDTVGEHRLRDDTERTILAEVRRRQEDDTLTPEIMEQLAERWEENAANSRCGAPAPSRKPDDRDDQDDHDDHEDRDDHGHDSPSDHSTKET